MVQPRPEARPRVLSLFGCAALAALFAGCSGGVKGDPNNRGPFELTLVTTGSKQVYPYTITKLDAFGQPGQDIINISTMDELRDNVNSVNGVLPVGTFGTSALLPDGNPGNQFLRFTFSHDLKLESILSNLPANKSNSGLTNNIQILAYDPVTEGVSVVDGIGFVGGKTYFGNDTEPTTAVTADKDGNVTIRDSRANGFPTGFSLDEALVNSKSFVFIPDSDDDLTTFETFPTNKVIRIIVTSAVQDYRDKPLTEEICSATTVGADTISPEVLGAVNTSKTLQITPGRGQVGVDPTASIRVSFSKPVQPRDIGEFFSTTNKTPSFRGITLNMTIGSATIPVLYYGDPLSPSDLCNFTIKPAYLLPSSTLHTITVNTSINSLVTNLKLGTQAQTTFTTGVGPGIVNAPVAPEAIYVGRNGSEPGVSVIDLNGFGQGTGDFAKFKDNNWKYGFKNNPNLGQPALNPPLFAGTDNMDAGSEGALSLTKDTNLKTLLLDSTVVAQVSDLVLGQPLDMVYNNENINAFVTRAVQQNPLTGAIQPGNCISFAPIPNPPKLTWTTNYTNPAFNIFSEPPQLSNTVPSPPCAASQANRLVIGNPFGTNVNTVGLFFSPAPGAFYGPQPAPGSPQPPIPTACVYNSRQQIGHFLYVLDRQNKQVLVVNSNRFQVLETIRLRDPFSMAISPNLKRLAVTNFSSGTVTFIDTDPTSINFHTIVGETRVGAGPTALAWQPEGEDLLVVNNRSNSMSIIGGADLTLRKTVISKINRPLDVAVTSRQQATGFLTGIYFAYILNGDGSIAVFESGPDGVNGIGFDDVVGLPEEAKFRNSRAIQPDVLSFNSAIWVAHQDAQGLGQVSHLELSSGPIGPLPIEQIQGGIIQTPTFRQRVWSVTGRLGGASPTTPIKDRLSGNNPVDLVVDEMNNVGGFIDMPSNQLSNLVYPLHSGKGQIHITPQGAFVPALTPRFLFVALADKGKVDVVEMDTGKVIRTLDVPGVSVLSTYFKQ